MTMVSSNTSTNTYSKKYSLIINYSYTNTSTSINNTSFINNMSTSNNIINVPNMTENYVELPHMFLKHLSWNRLPEVIYDGELDNASELDKDYVISNSSILYEKVINTLRNLRLTTRNIHLWVRLERVSWSMYGFGNTTFYYIWRVSVVFGDPSITDPYLYLIIEYESLNGSIIRLDFSRFFYTYVNNDKYSWVIADIDRFYDIVRWRLLTRNNMTQYLSMIMYQIAMYNQWSGLLSRAKIVMDIVSE